MAGSIKDSDSEELRKRGLKRMNFLNVNRLQVMVKDVAIFEYDKVVEAA